jgi:hypothetical protein
MFSAWCSGGKLIVELVEAGPVQPALRRRGGEGTMGGLALNGSADASNRLPDAEAPRSSAYSDDDDGGLSEEFDERDSGGRIAISSERWIDKRLATFRASGIGPDSVRSSRFRSRPDEA